MPVVGMGIKTIDAKRIVEFTPGVQVSNAANLKGITEHEIKEVGKNGLSVDFEFKSEYSQKGKKVGEITITGNVLYLDEKGDVVREWKKDKKLSDDVNIQIINAVLRRCTTKAIVLSEEVNLPPPIPLPVAGKKQDAEDSRYIG